MMWQATVVGYSTHRQRNKDTVLVLCTILMITQCREDLQKTLIVKKLHKTKILLFRSILSG